MDDKLALRMLDLIERFELENFALKSLVLTVSRSASMSKVEALLKEARENPEVREKVRERWQPLRDRLQSDSGLEAALEQFLKVTPLSKDLN